jgi:hypothetical protein
MVTLDSIQKNYPAISKAAGEFLSKLSGTGVARDIALASEMAGLMLLRASSADLSQIPSGMGILGAVPDEAAQTLTRFVVGFAVINGLDPKTMDFTAIPADVKHYLPELTRFEKMFYEICAKHQIEREFFPFTAAAAAGKLVLAGKQLGLLDANVGLAMLLFHIAAGNKTVPYPPGEIGTKPG